MQTITVTQPGLLTTIQDRGRWGYGKIGMPVAGVMDDYAARLGNLLLGNAEGAPVLEMTLIGPVLQFQIPTYFILTGGDLQPRLSGRPIALWTVQQSQPGDVLSFAGAAYGCRTYLAVAGGFQIPPVMGSASTYLRGKIGGYKGRALRAGDVLHLNTPSQPDVWSDFRVPAEYVPVYRNTLRVVTGPQDDAFTPKGLDTFLSAEYIVTPEADRMGYRLDGPVIEHRHGADILSDGIVLGAIQVPAHGKPIIMTADHQTTGGYSKIASVISVDMPSVAQKKPGDHLRFQKVTVREAQQLYRERERQLQDLKQFVQQKQNRRITCYTLIVDGQPYEVSVEELF